MAEEVPDHPFLAPTDARGHGEGEAPSADVMDNNVINAAFDATAPAAPAAKTSVDDARGAEACTPAPGGDCNVESLADDLRVRSNISGEASAPPPATASERACEDKDKEEMSKQGQEDAIKPSDEGAKDKPDEEDKSKAGEQDKPREDGEKDTSSTPCDKEDTRKVGSAARASPLLDLVFVLDATGSMGSYIKSAQDTIADVVQQIVATEQADVQFALVSYRDHPPQENTYVVQVYDFTKSVRKMRDYLDITEARGGGDVPEAVADGLHAAVQLPYRPGSTRVCILIADAPPHGGITDGDFFPEQCPCGLDPIAVCKRMVQYGITLYCVGVEPPLTSYKSLFTAFARITGGQYCPLNDAASLQDVVIGGVREEISLELAMREIQQQLSDMGGRMSPVSKAKFVQEELKKRGVKTRHLRRNGHSNAAEVTDEIVKMVECSTLDEARQYFKVRQAPRQRRTRRRGGSDSAERDTMDCAVSAGIDLGTSYAVASDHDPRVVGARRFEKKSVKLAKPAGFFATISSLFSSKGPAATAPRERAGSESASDAVEEDDDGHDDGSASEHEEDGAGVESEYPYVERYTVESDCASLDQCERMVQKAASRMTE